MGMINFTSEHPNKKKTLESVGLYHHINISPGFFSHKSDPDLDPG